MAALFKFVICLVCYFVRGVVPLLRVGNKVRVVHAHVLGPLMEFLNATILNILVNFVFVDGSLVVFVDFVELVNYLLLKLLLRLLCLGSVG